MIGIADRPVAAPPFKELAQSSEVIASPLAWLDRLKAFALLWIIANHIVERMIGGAAANNPTVPWPSLAERIAQFAPVRAGVLSWPATILRDFAWFGDQGVTLFIIVSGFGLTLGLLSRRAPGVLDLGDFYRRRGQRILPLWWGAHFLFAATGIFGIGLSQITWPFFASLIGARFLPSVFYYFSPAWWYVGLLIQLYLVYPLLWRVLRERGPSMVLGLGCAVGFIAIALGPHLFHDAYLDAWQRGSFFFTRLPEFALGIALASWWYANPSRVSIVLRSPLTWSAALIVYVVGTVLSFTLAGMIVAPLLLGASAMVILYPLVSLRSTRDDVVQRLGRESYPVYLVHGPFIVLFVPTVFSVTKSGFGILAALMATAIASVVLVSCSNVILSAFRTTRTRLGTLVATILATGAVSGLAFALVLADLAVLTLDPQEIDGWGERASLTPSSNFGWTLAPNRTTRLRWQSYDYRVTANHLGFPGAVFPFTAPTNATRILVTGDAFSSAEGVDTDQAWPRVLQSRLIHGDRSAQVMNFSITGYGPNQEAAVVKTFAPTYRPNIVIIEMFANDVEDATTSDADFRRSIGFAQAPQTGIMPILELAQLKRWIDLKIVDPIRARVKHKPTAEGYFLGSFRFLERGRTAYDISGVRVAISRYREIAAASAKAGATTVVVFVPTPVEVCGRSALKYYPESVHLTDRNRYDIGLPLRRARQIATAAHVGLWDLGPELRSLPACPYMPHNLHFTVAGNAAVAEYIAKRIQHIK